MPPMKATLEMEVKLDTSQARRALRQLARAEWIAHAELIAAAFFVGVFVGSLL